LLITVTPDAVFMAKSSGAHLGCVGGCKHYYTRARAGLGKKTTFDPCRLARQVKQFSRLEGRAERPFFFSSRAPPLLAAELLHLPDKPAGVGKKRRRC
jgi:hypothetical protein